MPKVSVIIPVYNVEKYLRQCLDSVVGQTLKDIEIICVNDCSPDASLAILQEYAQNDNRIKIIDLKENGGLGNARNVAMPEVTSDYIMFLDSDDWLEPNACETAYKQISQNNNDFVMFGFNDYSETTHKTKQNLSMVKNFYKNFQTQSFSTAEINFPFLENAFCWYKIYSRDFLINNNIRFCTTLYEDQLFNLKLYAFANSISVLYKPLYYYRRRKSSITQNPNGWQDLLSQKRKVLILAKEYQDKNNWFIRSSIVANINPLTAFYKNFSKLNSSIKKDLYTDVQKLFQELNTIENIEFIKKYIDYHEFKKIVKYGFYKKNLIDFLESIFLIYKSRQHIVINILGLKIKMKVG